jgi:hypothetical protein
MKNLVPEHITSMQRYFVTKPEKEEILKRRFMF